MDRIYFICLLLFLSLAACKKTAPKNYEITKIELARPSGYPDYGATFRIDSSLVYQYWGDYKDIKQGFFIGKISKTFWDTLNSKLNKAKFKTATPLTDVSCVDCRSYELIIYWNNHKRRFDRVSGLRQDSILAFMRWVDSSYKIISLKQIKDSIKFEVSPHEPPKPKFKSIAFPPPQKSNN